jgi:hypothetical protein
MLLTVAREDDAEQDLIANREAPMPSSSSRLKSDFCLVREGQARPV